MARILIVEDDDQVRGLIRKVLERAGFEVVVASNGNEAIKIFNNDPADLVIADILMPGKDGLEVVRDLKRNYDDVKIIAISGGGQIGPESYLDLAKKFGAEYTLTKPFSMSELLESVRKSLDK